MSGLLFSDGVLFTLSLIICSDVKAFRSTFDLLFFLWVGGGGAVCCAYSVK